MLKYSDVNRFCVDHQKELPRIWLITGNDEWGIDILEDKIIHHLQRRFDDIMIHRKEYQEVKNNTNDVIDLLNVPELFPTPKIVVVKNVTDTSLIENIIKRVINVNDKEIFLILKSTELRKTSKVTQLCHKLNSCVVGCYKPTNEEKIAYAERFFNHYRIRYASSAVIEIIAAAIINSWGALESELNKIKLYWLSKNNVGDKSLGQSISINEVTELCIDEREMMLEDLAISVLLDDISAITTNVCLAKGNKVNEIFILRAVANYIHKHIKVQKLITKGALSLKDAMAKVLFPLPFGKNYTNFVKVAQTIDLFTMEKLLHRILTIEANFKKDDKYFDLKHMLSFVG